MNAFHILFVAPNLNVGGAERQWSTLIRGLAARGIKTTVLTLDGRGPFFDEIANAGIQVYCAEWDKKRAYLSARKLSKRFGLKADLVVSRGLSAQYVGLAIARAMRVPHVVTEHTHYRLLRPSARRRSLLRLIARQAQTVVAVSQTQVDALRSVGYANAQICVIPNGVPTPEFPTPHLRDEVRSRLELNGDCVVTLVASLRAEKRIPDFIEAISQLRGDGVPIRGLVAGGGPDLESLRSLSISQGNAVAMLGQIQDVDRIWAASDIAVLTSSHEVLSMTLLEAMSHGLPLVTTDVGASRELCVSGVNGFTVPVGDVEELKGRLRLLTEDAGLRTSLGAASRHMHEDGFDVESMTTRYLELFRELVGI